MVSFVAYYVMHDYPMTASFLMDEEKTWAYHRLKYQHCKHTGRLVAKSEEFQWKYVVQAITDWQLIVNLFVVIADRIDITKV